MPAPQTHRVAISWGQGKTSGDRRRPVEDDKPSDHQVAQQLEGLEPQVGQLGDGGMARHVFAHEDLATPQHKRLAHPTAAIGTIDGQGPSLPAGGRSMIPARLWQPETHLACWISAAPQPRQPHRQPGKVLVDRHPGVPGQDAD